MQAYIWNLAVAPALFKAATGTNLPPGLAHNDDQLLSAFSAVLRHYRTEAHLSQKELAHRAGKSIRYISLLESRRHQPSLATLRRLCLGLGIPMEVFVRAIEARLAVQDTEE